MTVVVDPFIVGRCDAIALLGLDSSIEPWDLDRLLMDVGKRVLHQIYPAMIPIERRIAEAPPDEEWQLVSQLFKACPVGLRIEPATGLEGIALHVESSHVSRHDKMKLLDALEDAIASV